MEFADKTPTAAYIASAPSEITAQMWRWRVAAIGRYVERWLEADGGSSCAADTAAFLQHAGELAKLRATGAQPEKAFELYNKWGQTLWEFDDYGRRDPSGAFGAHVRKMEEVFFSIECGECGECESAVDLPVAPLVAAAVCARE